MKRQVVLCHDCFLLKTKLNSLSIPIVHCLTPTVLVLVVNWSHFQGVLWTIWLHTSLEWKFRIFPSVQRSHNVELFLVLTFSQFVHGIGSEKDGWSNAVHLMPLITVHVNTGRTQNTFTYCTTGTKWFGESMFLLFAVRDPAYDHITQKKTSPQS